MVNIKNVYSLFIFSTLFLNTQWYTPLGIAQNNGEKKVFKPIMPKAPPLRYFPETMPKPVDLPGVPIYPGKLVYEGGDKYNKDPNGTRYIMNYKVKALPNNIIDWYKKNLMPKWKIKMANSYLIAASDDLGNNLTVQVSQLGQGARLHIYFCPPFDPKQPQNLDYAKKLAKKNN